MYRFLSFSSLSILLFGFYFLVYGISNYSFEKDFIKSKVNFVSNKIYKSQTENEDLMDSSYINQIYSEKNIESSEPLDLKRKKRVIVNIKNKPINPLIINKGKEVLLANFNYEVLLDKMNYQNISSTKKEFIKTLLPLISYENQKILVERKNLYNIKRNLINQNTLNNQDLIYLKKTAKKYKIKIDNKHKIDLLEDLLISIDIIPSSIVLAQAANESGWGTSRFAQDYNAIFGEYTYDFTKGVIPLEREEGKTHFVKAFSSPDKSVESYFRNINTHFAYKKFRLIRKLMRDKNNFSNISLLVKALDTYAEDDKYVETISSIINSNNLNQFNLFSFSTSQS